MAGIHGGCGVGLAEDEANVGCRSEIVCDGKQVGVVTRISSGAG